MVELYVSVRTYCTHDDENHCISSVYQIQTCVSVVSCLRAIRRPARVLQEHEGEQNQHVCQVLSTQAGEEAVILHSMLAWVQSNSAHAQG